jgi:hypothetical protein
MMVFTLFAFDLYWASPVIVPKQPLFTLLPFFTYLSHWHIAFDFFMLAMSAGLFVVPLYAYLQIASKPETRARTIAANNIYNSLFMVMGTLLVMILLRLKVAIPEVFLIISILNVIAALCVLFCLNYQKRNALNLGI